MDWYIHHVNTPAVNVRKVASFLEQAVSMVHGSKWLYPEEKRDLKHNPDTIAFYGEECRGIHACKPLVTFAHDLGLLHNPTIGGHFALNVSDIDGVIARLKQNGVEYTHAGTYAIAGVVQIYFFDPSMNLIELNQIVGPEGGVFPRPGETHDIHREAVDWYIHHVCLCVHDLTESVTFFENVVGLGTCTRLKRDDSPELAVFGAEYRGVHLTEPGLHSGQANGLSHNPTVGGHYAITVPDLAVVKARLDASQTPYSTASDYEFPNVEQLFVSDPEHRLVEINQVNGNS